MRAHRWVTLCTAALVVAACDDSTEPDDQETFTATLTGQAERPNPVTTSATGTATVNVDTDTNTFTYTLNVSNITGVSAAHIHGPATVEESAGVLVPLTTPTTAGVSGSFGQAQITAQGVSADSLLALLRAGRAYVNVHTSANPPGEIRGQLTRR